MMPAEKWYEYQENYQKYGLEMKPKEEKRKPRAKKIGLTSRDKAGLLGLILTVGIICIGLIIMTAYAATLKYDNNQIIMSNNELKVEIEELNKKVEVAKNIKSIEKKAVEDLGMIKPKKSQIIYLSDPQGEDADSAATPKEKAYY